MRLLKLVQLESMAHRYPHQLSGGQRQRVALARALAIEPKVLLLDEPFGALDAKVRQELRQWLRRLHDEIHLTSVFVTHDQDEALELADRVLVMNEGRIEQIGTPDEVFHKPATEFVVKFLGQVNFFHGAAGGRQGPFRHAGLGIARTRRHADPAGPRVHPSARTRRRRDAQRPSGASGRGDANPLGRSERAAGVDGRVGRAAPCRAYARALPLAEDRQRQHGLRHAPRGEGVRRQAAVAQASSLCPVPGLLVFFSTGWKPVPSAGFVSFLQHRLEACATSSFSSLCRFPSHPRSYLFTHFPTLTRHRVKPPWPDCRGCSVGTPPIRQSRTIWS